MPVAPKDRYPRGRAQNAGPRFADRKWDNYFRHAVAKNVFAMLDNFAWWRVIRMLRERHRWRWKDIRRRLVTPAGSWRPITAGEIELRRMAAIPVTRYRNRGNQIPNPWTAEPAGNPVVTRCSPAPPLTRPANVVKLDETSSAKNTAMPPVGARPRNPPAA